jgi:hypothetical protein
MGLPDWKSLTFHILNEYTSYLDKNEKEKCEKLFKSELYPEVFSELLKKLGPDPIFRKIDKLLDITNKSGRVYDMIISWPFSCYLTTNFDDSIEKIAQKLKLTFLLKKNSQEDLSFIRADNKDMIFKIHGDTKEPCNIVLTREQFEEFQKDSKRKYWRDKIFSVLNMVDLVIIGYSLRDPEFNEQLERAEQIANPNHPIFMIATGFTSDQIKDYYLKYNIRIISYQNRSGNHSELFKLLKRYEPFIVKRGSKFIDAEKVDESQATKAASMYLFAQLNLIDENSIYIIKIYSSFILQILFREFKGDPIEFEYLLSLIEKEKYFNTNIDPIFLDQALEYLNRHHFIKISQTKQIILEAIGNQTQEKINRDRELLRDKFERACEIFLSNSYSELTKNEILLIIFSMREGLIKAFRKRGLEIARMIYNDSKLDFSDNIDILDLINESSSTLDQSSRTAFADLMIEILVNPNDVMKDFLSALTQGYFSYHALGLDVGCYNERLKLAKEKNWIIDSCIILPFLAIDSPNYGYANDLIKRLSRLELQCMTTESLLSEVIEHISWALNHFDRLEKNPLDMLQTAQGGPGFKQNLFIAGYISWSSKQANPTFEKYIEKCIGSADINNVSETIRKVLETNNIIIVDFNKLKELTDDLVRKKESVAKEIETIRKRNATFRSENQCLAESEIIIFNEIKKCVFISQSIHLNQVQPDAKFITWTPETLYRFLILLSPDIPSKDLLYECMTQDFFYSGFSIIDKGAISSFISPLIHQSRMMLEDEKESYNNLIKGKRTNNIMDEFENQPDELKPFYSIQTTNYIARMLSDTNKTLINRMGEIQKHTDLSDKERKEFLRLKSKAEQKKKKHIKLAGEKSKKKKHIHKKKNRNKRK